MGIVFKAYHAVFTCSAYFMAAFFSAQTCLSCGEFCMYLPLCKGCRVELEENIVPRENRCIFCGRILLSEKQSCLECRTSKIFVFLDSVFPLYPYVLWKKELLFRWKTAGNRSFSSFFARVLFKVLHKYYTGLPIVPVPPRPGKVKKNGWDQIEDLCRYLRGLYGIRIYKALTRIGSQQQKKLNRKERFAYSGKQYVLKQKYKRAEKLPTVLVLLDDIVTTGVTLENCASVLKEAGVKEVHALTLFSC